VPLRAPRSDRNLAANLNDGIGRIRGGQYGLVADIVGDVGEVDRAAMRVGLPQ